MSRIDITTRDLYKRLGSDSRSRSVRADALFRRLRTETQPTIEELLAGAPRKISIGDKKYSRLGPRQSHIPKTPV